MGCSKSRRVRDVRSSAVSNLQSIAEDPERDSDVQRAAEVDREEVRQTQPFLLPGMVPSNDDDHTTPAQDSVADIQSENEIGTTAEQQANKSNHFNGPKPDPAVQAKLEGHKRLMQLRRKKEVLRLVPIHLSVLQRAEPDSGWTEAVISLYRHVLPSLGRSHIDGIVRNDRTDTLLFVRSARAKSDGVPKEEDGPGGPGTNAESKEPESASSSSFSDSDVEEGSSGEDEDDDDDDDEEEGDDVDDLLDEPESPDGSLTAKQRIIGAITWEPIPNAIQPRTRVLQLTLIGCRTKYQGYGIASRLMRECKDPLVCGMDYDVITTFADHNAVPFFAKQGFNDDKILNSRYISYLDDDWDQSILMSYTRPRAAVAAAQRSTTAYGPPDISSEMHKAKLAARIEGWKAARMEEYSSQLQLVEQLVNEVSALQGTLATVEGRLSHLNRDYAALRRRNVVLEQELALTRASSAAPAAADRKLLSTYVPSNNGMLFGALDPRCAEFEAVREMLAGPQSSDSCGESAGAGRLHLQRVTKSCFPSDHPVLTNFVQHSAHLAAGGLQQQLFFGGEEELLTSWFEHGFPKKPPPEDDSLAIYGKGYYFSKRADKAHYYTHGGGKLLLGIVAMGCCTTVIAPDRARTAPPPPTASAPREPDGEVNAKSGLGAAPLHSMLVPGRPRPSQRMVETSGSMVRPQNITHVHQFEPLLPGLYAILRLSIMWQGALANHTAAGEGEEEYVIFDGHQVLPLYLIEYSATPTKQSITKPTTGVSRDLKPNPFEEVEHEPEALSTSTRATTQTAFTADSLLLHKLDVAAGDGGGTMKAQDVAMTPRDLQARRECTDSELLSALRKIRAIEANGTEDGQTLEAPSIGCKKIREIVTSEYGWAVSEKRIKRLLKEDVMAAQLLELAASPSRPEEPPENDELDPEAGPVGAPLPQEQGGIE